MSSTSEAATRPAGSTTAPDIRGSTSPFAVTVLVVGWFALLLVLGGTLAIQVVYGVRGGPVTQACIDQGVIPYQPATATGPAKGSQGAPGVCHIIEGLTSAAQTAVLAVGVGVGTAVLVLGLLTYRRQETRRRRDHVITGALLGSQALVLGALLWVFTGSPAKVVTQFLNLHVLDSPEGRALFKAAGYTLFLAFGGEVGGIVIGLGLSLLVLSKRRAVRAPARIYINVFRGTPLLVQLSIGYFAVNLGLGLHLGPFTVAIAVLALNAGAYTAEVFRAGIQSIERGQMEAARSMGMSYLQSMRYAIVPQAVRRVIPPLLNEFVILIKDTSLVIILGLPLTQLELFSAAQQGYSDTFSATFFVAAALGYLIVTLPMIGIVNIVEKRLRSGLVSVAGM